MRKTTTGGLFLVPFTAGDAADQATLEQAAIQSITFDALASNSGDMVTDRLDSDFTDAVDGYDRDDTFQIGDADFDGDVVDGADGPMDAVFGRAGNDTIDGGAGNDVIYGDKLDGSDFGSLNFQNTENLQDAGGTNAFEIRAVELIRLANGDLIMISSERNAIAVKDLLGLAGVEVIDL